MLTDAALIARLATELEQALRGARVLNAGVTDDGRVALAFRVPGKRMLLALDLFGSPPIATIEPAELDITKEAGFVRTLATTLRGMTLAKVSARRGDRLLRITFQSRSRFGVADALDLYVELVPRFGNAVVVKGETVVAAAKEFTLAENGTRAVMPGFPYILPPLPPRTSKLRPAIEPEETTTAPLYAYRRNGTLLQAYVVPLEDVSEALMTRESSLLDLFAELRAQRAAAQRSQGAQHLRGTLLERLDRRERKLREELRLLAEKRARAVARGGLRAEGEAIFGSLHELPERDRNEAKERATKRFSEYKKLGATLPHVEKRERHVQALIDATLALRWEAERTDDEELRDVEAAVAQLDPRQVSRPRAPTRPRKRAPLELRTNGGSRIFVGRSPSENADVTFRIARPNDLWFHARGTPGAHVVLTRDDRAQPPIEDLEAAAALAAFHSKARASTSVPVDYTQRKYVRKRPDAPPGLVWYTRSQTIVAQPNAAPAAVIAQPREGSGIPSAQDRAKRPVSQ
jgi:predicted ribosome quality control (RQC) complex YloA/Tae2 family protein